MKLATLSLLALSLAVAVPAAGQQYPNRAIRVVVGFSPGGGTDVSARIIGRKLNESLGQPVVIENRPGASGNTAAGLVAKSAPDGYTLLFASSAIAFPSLFTNIPFDVNKDLAFISLVAMGPSVLIAHPSLPVKDVKQLVALARARPKQVLYGSPGFGTVTHLAMEVVMSRTGADLTHVPYKGASTAAIGLMSGEVHVLFASVPTVLTQIQSGRLRALGVSTLKRSSVLPDVPTIAESALPDYNTGSWYGLVGPAGIPKNVLDLLSAEVGKILRNREIREDFARARFEPEGTTPEAFSAFVRSEIAKYEQVIRKANLKPLAD